MVFGYSGNCLRSVREAVGYTRSVVLILLAGSARGCVDERWCRAAVSCSGRYKWTVPITRSWTTACSMNSPSEGTLSSRTLLPPAGAARSTVEAVRGGRS